MSSQNNNLLSCLLFGIKRQAGEQPPKFNDAHKNYNKTSKSKQPFCNCH